MRAHVLQHVSFEGIGSIESWLKIHGASVSYTRFYESTLLPDIDDIDLIIVMGGPMSVNDETTFPWLKKEKRFIFEAIQAEKAIVGICLGAQLIASALDARVYPGSDKEIGWFDIEGVSTGSRLFQFPRTTKVFHWHGETFDLPIGATCLAKSSICQNQAFQVGQNVIGLQFHLETTPESADLIIRNCRSELVVDQFIQSEETMLEVPETNYKVINRLMNEVLSYITLGLS